jgi:drug/metabolite transporter (DMT)-like permease
MSPPRVPAPPRTAGRSGILLGLLAPLLWSSSGMFVKLLTLDAVPLAGLRALFAGLALAPFLRVKGLRLDATLAALLVSYTVSHVGYVAAVKLTTAANAIALVSTAPAWVLLLSWAAARRVAWAAALPVAMILAGVGIMLAEPASGHSLEGNLLALLAGAGFGVFTFSLPRSRISGPGLVSLCNLATAGIVFAAQPSGLRVAGIAPWEWAALVYLGTIQIGLATVCFAAALRRIPALQGSILALLEPLLAPIWVYWAVGELPSAYGLAGAACILGGIVSDALLRTRPRSRAPAGPRRRNGASPRSPSRRSARAKRPPAAARRPARGAARPGTRR